MSRLMKINFGRLSLRWHPRPWRICRRANVIYQHNAPPERVSSILLCGPISFTWRYL